MEPPPLPRGWGCLPGVSAPTSRASAPPWLPPAPRNPNCARGLSGWLPFTLQPRTRRPAVPRPLTRPHHGGAAAAPGHPQNGINERALEDATSERGDKGRGQVRGACGSGSGRPAQTERAGTRRSAAAGCQVRVSTERPRWEEKKEGSLTRFSASLGARRLGLITPRPASGLGWSGLPYTLLRIPASRIQVTRHRPRPAPPLCATLRFPQPRLPC